MAEVPQVLETRTGRVTGAAAKALAAMLTAAALLGFAGPARAASLIDLGPIVPMGMNGPDQVRRRRL